VGEPDGPFPRFFYLPVVGNSRRLVARIRDVSGGDRDGVRVAALCQLDGGLRLPRRSSSALVQPVGPAEEGVHVAQAPLHGELGHFRAAAEHPHIRSRPAVPALAGVVGDERQLNVREDEPPPIAPGRPGCSAISRLGFFTDFGGYADDGMPHVAQERKRTELLSLVDVLEPLSIEELEELAAACPSISLTKGEDVYHRREHREGLFIIEQGRVRVYRVSIEGDQLTLALLSAGTVLSGRRLQGLHAEVMEPSTIAFMTREYLEGLIRKKPAVGLRLADVLADRLRLMDARMSDIIHKEVPVRLASLILQLLDEEGVVSGERYLIPTVYTHQQLGTMIGAKRVAVARAFGKLREAGAVEVEQSRLYVKNLKALEHVASVRR
jgi:CRP/FNR family cyclic AMP-dependent transcriptional regulator